MSLAQNDQGDPEDLDQGGSEDLELVDVLLEPESDDLDEVTNIWDGQEISGSSELSIEQTDSYSFSVSVRDDEDEFQEVDNLESAEVLNYYPEDYPEEDNEPKASVEGSNLEIKNTGGFDYAEIGFKYQNGEDLEGGLAIMEFADNEPGPADDEGDDPVDDDPAGDDVEDDPTDEGDTGDGLDLNYDQVGGLLSDYELNDLDPEDMKYVLDRSLVLEDEKAVMLNPNHDYDEIFSKSYLDGDSLAMSAGGALCGGLMGAATALNPALGILAGGALGYGLGRSITSSEAELRDMDDLDDDLREMYENVMKTEVAQYDIVEPEEWEDYETARESLT